MKNEHLKGNPEGETISHHELADALTIEVLRRAREEGDGIVPPKTVLGLIAFTVSPDFAQEIVNKVEQERTNNTP